MLRFLTAASLYDGHDVSINIIRRILQSKGAEVVHLGHNRGVDELVQTALEEDVHAIAISSYQGGHMEYFRYCRQRLDEMGLSHVRLYGGGGGVIVPDEIAALEEENVARIFSPDDGRNLGLTGMVDEMIRECSDAATTLSGSRKHLEDRIPDIIAGDKQALAQAISLVENADADTQADLADVLDRTMTGNSVDNSVPVLGVTGTGGAGKSSLLDEILRRLVHRNRELNVGMVSIDPTKRKTGGALLGDRIRMNTLPHPRIFMRSLATRSTNTSTSAAVKLVIQLMKLAGHGLIIVETSGIGQSDTQVVDISDVYMYVMTSDYGAATQLEKIDMIDYADLVVLNKYDRKGSPDALRDIRKQYRRAHLKWDGPDEMLPVFPSIASRFRDKGVDTLFDHLLYVLKDKTGHDLGVQEDLTFHVPRAHSLIPAERTRYLSDISDAIDQYHGERERQATLAGNLHAVRRTLALLREADTGDTSPMNLQSAADRLSADMDAELREQLENWQSTVACYRDEKLVTRIRDREITHDLQVETLSGSKIPRVALPRYSDWGDLLRWLSRENLPGHFPFTAGVFPFKRTGEDPTRMFAGEGTPERTNRRFHYLSSGQKAARLSTAFDSVTLYGYDPAERPDIYGKIGNAGVSIATVDDMKKLYCGFDLCDPSTSVSMTINGPAPMILAMFFNTAIDQQVERHLKESGQLDAARKRKEEYFRAMGVTAPVYTGKDNPEGDRGFGLFTLGIPGSELVDADTYARIREATLKSVRGTVQADILKEDQAQNTCIFSTDFAMKMMGDVQESFIGNQIRNYYSVSISGYHIAEAGANPITQLAFTLANGFTYVEYYLARGMDIDAFAPNLSFFFSNGLDPEYSVIGRVARRIWAIAMKYRYGGNERSQKLKYHIQTSGRSLHAQEIDFNDIRTTLQALTAVYDNCNSLHTNAYDEAITTPTEASVRRALAIQMIINREFGMTRNENPMQGSFIVEELTDLVEEAVLMEFRRICERGGVTGAMETMYQRGRIQEESMKYEHLKHSGDLPIIGVNTFERPAHMKGEVSEPTELIRSTDEEKNRQIENLRAFQHRNRAGRDTAITELRKTAENGGNIFDRLMDTVNSCSLGEISHALFDVGGSYRRNM